MEHATLTPLVLAASGGLGVEASCFYKRLASLLLEEWDTHYSSTLRWLWCSLSFSLLRSAIMVFRGSRSAIHHKRMYADYVDLVIAKA